MYILYFPATLFVPTMEAFLIQPDARLSGIWMYLFYVENSVDYLQSFDNVKFRRDSTMS